MKQFVFSTLLTGALALSTFAAAQAQQAVPQPESKPVTDQVHMFSYFREPNGVGGLNLAWSEDGLTWQDVKREGGFIKPEVGKDRLMRDPMIARGPDGTFHMVWTTGWRGSTIGYASSKDLIHWSPQKAIDVMGDTEKVRNCWAPEIIYDDKREQWLIFWATTIEGQYPETQAKGDPGNHRIYSCTTKDFETFSAPRLLFNPGYVVIDSTILPVNGRYVMVFKDETLEPVAQKNLRAAWSDDVEGPYSEITPPFSPPYWVEGPSILPVGEDYLIYFDVYSGPNRHYGAMKTRDFKVFENISQQVHFPRGTRHGTAFTVPRAILENLQKPTPPEQKTNS